MGNVIEDTPSKLVAELTNQVNDLIADVATIRTILNAHVHNGITAGAANSGAPTTTAAAATSTAVVEGE